jgi:ElaA protein
MVSWAELSTDALYAILQLRNEVFVVEQDCPYQDCDDLDQQCDHLWTTRDNIVIAYARLVPPGVRFAEPSIGRVITSPTARGGGLGKRLMREAIDRCQLQWPTLGIRISAQSYLKTFYEGFGFRQTGSEYLEDDIPHFEMFRESLEA